MEHTRFVGLDIHKERISIAVAESGRSGAVEYLGEISNDPDAIGKLCDRLCSCASSSSIGNLCFNGGRPFGQSRHPVGSNRAGARRTYFSTRLKSKSGLYALGTGHFSASTNQLVATGDVIDFANRAAVRLAAFRIGSSARCE
jgi:hypothetical protein